MGSLTNTTENDVLDHILGTTTWTAPSTIYVALTTTTPTDTAAGTEVSGGSYARESATFSAAASGATSNSSTITFPTASASWGTVTAVNLYDAVSGGNRLAWASLGTSKTVGDGDTFSIPSGDLDVSLD